MQAIVVDHFAMVSCGQIAQANCHYFSLKQQEIGLVEETMVGSQGASPG
jgi:hypothetical protein